MIPATEEMTNFTFKMDKKTRERYWCPSVMLWDFPCPLQLLRW